MKPPPARARPRGAGLLLPALFLLVATWFDGAWASSAIEGLWQTYDDKSGDLKAVVEIYERDGRYRGVVRQVFRKPGEDPDPLCIPCRGEHKDQRVIGMEILWDFEPRGNNWEGGRILDPENGKIYRCKIKLREGKLLVRGFIGISLIGRTQTWLRVTAEAAIAAPQASGER